MLSNTATPKYYGAFREQVINGIIPVNREVSMEMNRIDALIEDPNYYYDDEAVEGWIAFCERELTLTDGSDMKLLDSFKLWGEQVYGWYYFVKRSVYEKYPDQPGGHWVNKLVKTRLTKKQYLIVGRGAAKSIYDYCIQAFELVTSPQTTHQITTAPTMPQAEEVMSPFRTALIKARGPVFQFMTQGSIHNTENSQKKLLASTKMGIVNNATNSLLQVRPMTIDKLQGLRCPIATVDEWLSGDIKEDVVGALEQSASKMPEYLIIATSSEGTVRNGPGDTIKLELLSILKGEYYAPHVSIWWYKLDDVSEVSNPAMWLKANPNLGKPGMVSYETYQLDVERAEHSPSARNDILAKRFGLPMEGYTYFFTYEETKAHKYREFWSMRCAVGADLSLGDDFCSFAFLFPLVGTYTDMCFGVKTRNYITEHTLNSLPLAMRYKYEDFIQEGSLIIMPGTILDMTAVYDDLIEYIERSDYDVQCFGYDPYNAKDFVERWAMDNGPFGIEKVPQGSKTESVPLGELKKLAEERKLLFDQGIMEFAMGNCVTIEDTNGNRKLLKERRDKKIDCVAAMMDAFVAYKMYRDAFD